MPDQEHTRLATESRGDSAAAKARARAGLALAAPAGLWLVVFTLGPLLLIVLVSFWRSSMFGLSPDWTLRNWDRLWSSPVYLDLLLKTFRIAALTTLVTLLLSYPMALVLANQQGLRKASLVLVLFLPFWIGYVVRTFAWLPVLGRNGVINQALLGLGLVSEPVDWLLYNEFAVYVGLVYIYLLFMILPIFLSLDRIDRALIEAAYDLYARPWAVFRHVLLPLSLPGVLAGCVMVFLLTFGAYVTPALLGGASGITFANVIAAQFLTDRNWALGSALSLAMVAVVIGTLILVGRRIGLQSIFLHGRGH